MLQKLFLTYGSPIDCMKIRGSTGTKSQAITRILKDNNECFWIEKRKGHMHVLPIGLLNRFDLLIYDIVQMIDLKLFSYMYMEKPIFVGFLFTEWRLI